MKEKVGKESMGKFILLFLILQITLLAGEQIDTSLAPKENELTTTINYEEQNETNNFANGTWQEKFKAYLSNSERTCMLAITTGLSFSYLKASLDDFYRDESFEDVVFGPHLGLSVILNKRNTFNPKGIGLEFETGLYFTRGLSKSSDYDELKASKGINYLRVPLTIKGVKQLKSEDFLSAGYSLYVQKGMSKEFDSYNLGSSYVLGYRRKRIEAEMLVSFVYFDITTVLFKALALNEIAGLVYKKSLVVKFSLKYRI
jgi:hypothetical protein